MSELPENHEIDPKELPIISEDLIKNESATSVASLSQAEAPLQTFSDAELNPALSEAIASLGWTAPTPVQSLCLPYTLKKRDVAGFAQTGTGKTGVFLITVAQQILSARETTAQTPDSPSASNDQRVSKPFSVVLCPTRELAMQIDADAQPIFNKLGIRSLAVLGGMDYEKQAQELRNFVDVVFATPGRIKDFLQKKIVSLEKCKIFVCDEADRMFDMGFIDDVVYFLDRLPENTQKLLFSATTNDQVKELAFEYLNNPEYISVNPESLTPENIDQHAVIVEARHKLKVMLGMLQDHKPECSIIFTNTKLTADWLHYKLSNNGIDADLITGDLPQKKRVDLIHRIKAGKVKALIATDVASRGLHISRVTHVYNFDLPDDPANYVHRIGRTARAGAKGFSYSIVCEDYGDNLVKINELLGEKYQVAAKWFPEGYLSIVDKAENPYKNRLAADRTAHSQAGRSQPRSSQPNRSDDRSPTLGTKNRGPQRPNQNSHGSRNSSPNQRHTSNHATNHNARPSTSSPQIKGLASIAKPSQNTSLWSLIKRLMQSLLGKR